jgi:hypothetical protein
MKNHLTTGTYQKNFCCHRLTMVQTETIPGFSTLNRLLNTKIHVPYQLF